MEDDHVVNGHVVADNDDHRELRTYHVIDMLTLHVTTVWGAI